MCGRRKVAVMVAVFAIASTAALAGGSVIDGMVGHWRFDDSGNLGADSSAYVNDGTNFSATASTGPIGPGAATFESGSNSGYIGVPDSASLDSAAGVGLDRTVSFWFKTTTDQNRVVLEKGANQHFVIQTEGGGLAGKISYRTDGPNSNRVLSAASVNDDAWHHFAATYRGGDHQMELFIDGVSQGTNTQASAVANNDPLVIGARDGGSFSFPGSIDDVAVWNKQLSDGAVRGIYEAGLEGRNAASVDVPTMTSYTWQMLKDNPRFYWSFNENGNTGDARDLVRGQTNDDLTAQGDAHRSASNGEALGYAAQLDGSGDYFYAANLDDTAMPGAWAMEMWVKADGSLAGSRADYLVHVPSDARSNDPGFIYDFGDDNVDNEIELFGAGRTDDGPTIDDNDWHHVVATFYGNDSGFGVADRVDMAIDGTVTTVTREGFSSALGLNNGLFVGSANSVANFFDGQIDEVAFYDLSGLSETQVAARTQQIAGHYALASEPAETKLRYLDNVSYEIDPSTPASNYGAPFDERLTDGEIGSSGANAWDQGVWVGWSNTDPVITFDLQRSAVLDSIFIDYLGGQYTPDDVTVEFSVDGSDFSLLPSISSSDFNDFGPGGQARRLILDANDTLARYARMSFATDDGWMFLGEMTFVERVPEPTSALLATLGLLGMLLVRRRRR